MQRQSNRDSRQLKLDFGIDYAPAKVREHGLRDAHSYPLVSQGKRSIGEHSASFRVPAAEAWDFPEIELRAGNSWPAIVLDIDGANALQRIVLSADKGEVLTPKDRDPQGGPAGVFEQDVAFRVAGKMV